MPRVAVFAPGRLAPFRLAEAGGEPTGLALGPLPVDHEAQARVDTEGRDVRQVQWLAQGLRPPRQAEGLECGHRGMGEPEAAPLSSASYWGPRIVA
jgi:hypothetical protein